MRRNSFKRGKGKADIVLALILVSALVFSAVSGLAAEGQAPPAVAETKAGAASATGTTQISPEALETLGAKDSARTATGTVPMIPTAPPPAVDAASSISTEVTAPTPNDAPAEADGAVSVDVLQTPAAATATVAVTDQVPQAATQTVQTIPMFIVRSAPILTRQDKDERVQILKSAGYHPVVRRETMMEGREFFVLELGRFAEMEMAVDLLLKLKNVATDFFVAGTKNEGNILKGGILKELYSGADGEDENAMDLLAGHAAIARSNAVSSDSESVERLIVRKLIRAGDKGMAGRAGDEKGALAAATLKSAGVPLSASSRMFRMKTADMEPAEGASLSVREQLLKVAWRMREGGYDVRLEDEDKPGPEGKLVGIFNNKEDSIELARELQEYGYSVTVIQGENGSGLFGVYTDPESVSGDISIITPDVLGRYKQKKGFVPPEDAPADTLLKLMRTQQN